MYKDLRKQSAMEISSLPFDGVAVGGLSVGEPHDLMYDILEETIQWMPKGKAKIPYGRRNAGLSGGRCGTRSRYV